MYDNKPSYNKPKKTHFKEKKFCFVCGKYCYHASQSRNKARRDDKSTKPNTNLVEVDDIIIGVSSQPYGRCERMGHRF